MVSKPLLVRLIQLTEITAFCIMKYPYDQPGVYAIHIAGRLDDSWSGRLGGMTIQCTDKKGRKDQPVTVLHGWLPDQAALFGVLDTLYNAHYPVLFVSYLRPGDPVQSPARKPGCE